MTNHSQTMNIDLVLVMYVDHRHIIEEFAQNAELGGIVP
jgi:hypothetical protein